MFLLYHSEGCNICESVLCECYVNGLYTTTCSGVLGHCTPVAHASSTVAPVYSKHILLVKMTSDNYLFWQAQVVPLLHSHSL
jgi:hypothetical protein